MTALIRSCSLPARPFPADLLQAVLAIARTWSQRAATRRALAQLDAHALDDIGLGEAERQRECFKPFWQA